MGSTATATLDNEMSIVNSNGDFMLDATVRLLYGETIGQLKEVRGALIRVSSGLQDYWLSKECIDVATDTDLKLKFGTKELERHKMTLPDAAA